MSNRHLQKQGTPATSHTLLAAAAAAESSSVRGRALALLVLGMDVRSFSRSKADDGWLLGCTAMDASPCQEGAPGPITSGRPKAGDGALLDTAVGDTDDSPAGNKQNSLLAPFQLR